ncbi:MAG: zinc ribbon domain-containing protein [Acidimicrobiales bacterium]
MADPADTESAETGTKPLILLLEVQQRDLLIDQLSYRRRELQERKALGEIDARIQALEIRGDTVRSESSHLGQRQADIESQVVTYTDRIAAIENRLRQGGAYREVQAMSEETGSLARHRRELEDKELEVMELLEPVEQELEAIEGELSMLAGEREVAAAALAGAEASLDSELAKVHAERDTLATGLPSDLSATYERLRQRLGGIGAAKLIDGACGGCHLHLPSGERERLLHSAPGEVVYCDQCGRILVA